MSLMGPHGYWRNRGRQGWVWGLKRGRGGERPCRPEKEVWTLSTGQGKPPGVQCLRVRTCVCVCVSVSFSISYWFCFFEEPCLIQISLPAPPGPLSPVFWALHVCMAPCSLQPWPPPSPICSLRSREAGSRKIMINP